MLRFRYGALSHVGLVREHNEDSGFAGPYLQLVADGVGGAAAGEVASATTAYVVSALSAQPASWVDGSGRDLEELLRTAVARAHDELHHGVAADPGRAGMATTLTAVLTYHDEVVLAHVGDSRCYLLRDGRLERLTTDHTFVQSLLDEGRISPEDAASHPYRSMVLRWIDGQEGHDPTPDVQRADVRAGDRLMLCSDGLTDLVRDETVAGMLATPDSDEAAALLVDAALRAGGRDNVTVLVADVEDGPLLRPDGRLLGALGDPMLVVDPAAVRLT